GETLPEGGEPALGPDLTLSAPAGPARDSLLPIVLTSALFAAVHIPQWPAPIAIFFLSVGLGVVYQRMGSLFASFLLHALFNAFSTLTSFQSVLLGQPAVPKVAPTATCFQVATHRPAAAESAASAKLVRLW